MRSVEIPKKYSVIALLNKIEACILYTWPIEYSKTISSQVTQDITGSFKKKSEWVSVSVWTLE